MKEKNAKKKKKKKKKKRKTINIKENMYNEETDVFNEREITQIDQEK